MSIALPRGILAISVDLELDALQSRPQQQRSLTRVATQLLQLFAKHRLPATWGLADPAVSPSTELLTRSNIPHEIAVLGDSMWVGSSGGRVRFSRELQRRVGQAREAGLPVTSLMLRNVNLDAHLDLVVKNGITAVRGPASACRKSEFNQPQSLYAGLWLMWPSRVLPGVSRYWPGGGSVRATRRGLEQSVQRREVFHLLINSEELTERGWLALHGIESVLRRAAKLRSQGRLEIVTLSGAVGLLSNVRQTAPARSILRPAA